MPGVPRKSLPDALGAYRGGKPCLHVAATARPAKAETGTRQATAVKIRREKNRTITTVRFFCFPTKLFADIYGCVFCEICTNYQCVHGYSKGFLWKYKDESFLKT